MSQNNPILDMMQAAANANASDAPNLAGFLPSQAIAAAAATSAAGLGLYSQWLGAMHGAATGAAKAPPAYFNPFTFEWVSVEGSTADETVSEKPIKVKRNNEQKAKPAAKPVEKKSVPQATAQQQFVKPDSVAKPETPDDLKLISGVGPKLEKVLNSLGVWTFAQIANWNPEHIAWVDDFLQFSGRIERDDWIKQANNLM